jgi:hypothetical protein
MDRIDNLVLGTVNAPWKTAISAEDLAHLVDAGQVDEHLLHLASFFGEVRPELILAFAEAHGISRLALRRTYNLVRVRTGEENNALTALLG